MRPVELPEDIRLRCLEVSAALDLPLAGIDLLRDAEDRWWCFEVNPSPAYSCFEEPTGLPIAAALARWLAGFDPL
jgi:glutathione synthase/RimK-type ligase-like ATP-grasp enzyme